MVNAEPASLSVRARKVLYAVVTEFISSGEPVGSRTLAKKYGFGLSAATIRNVASDLEQAGYLRQPHASAGRIPTDRAFRCFIESLAEVQRPSADTAARIRQLGECYAEGDLLNATSKLLSDLSGTAAVAVRKRTPSRTVLKIRFITTRPTELVSVVVFSDGTVENRFISLERPLSNDELERLHNLLEEAADGRSLAEVRDYFRVALERSQDELNALYQLGSKLTAEALKNAEMAAEVVIEGRSRLLESPELTRAEQVRELVKTLEDRTNLVALLDRVLAASRVQVFLGEELGQSAENAISMVAAPYREGDGWPGGAVGIIGPTRMNYPLVIPLVEAAAEAVSSALAGGRSDSADRHPNNGPGSSN